MSDGTKARLGVRVRWRNNLEGVIIAYDKSEGYVKIRFDDGTVRTLSKNKLTSCFLTASA